METGKLDSVLAGEDGSCAAVSSDGRYLLATMAPANVPYGDERLYRKDLATGDVIRCDTDAAGNPRQVPPSSILDDYYGECDMRTNRLRKVHSPFTLVVLRIWGRRQCQVQSPYHSSGSYSPVRLIGRTYLLLQTPTLSRAWTPRFSCSPSPAGNANLISSQATMRISHRAG